MTLNGMRKDGTHAISTTGWSLEYILAYGSRFRAIERVDASSPRADIERAVKRYEEEGIPMVIEGWHKRKEWPQELFSLDFFQKNSPSDDIAVRNVHDLKDSRMSLELFIEQCRATPSCIQPDEDVRMYGKDAECPEKWKQWLKDSGFLPQELMWNGPEDYLRYRPANSPVVTLMCYLGIGDTFTAAHKDLCASSGHNLMCYTENNGASYWFMTKGSDIPDVSEYFQKMGHELDHETHVVSLSELKRAPFDVYVCKQELGDLVLVPPRSCHQVVNAGGITLKTSWSRMSLMGLTIALYHELPLYQRVCRFATYRVKSTIFHSMRSQTDELRALLEGRNERRTRQIIRSLKTLFVAFAEILDQEYVPPSLEIAPLALEDGHPAEDSTLWCHFCGADIFQGYLDCRECSPKEEKAFNICAACFVDGRSCRCRRMRLKRVFSFEDLIQAHRSAAEVLRRSGEDGIMPFQPRQEHSSLFLAACLLHGQRDKMVLCNRHRKNERGLNCASCHHSKCFNTLLTSYQMHASDALLLHRLDKSHSTFHKRHMDMRREAPRFAPLVKQFQRLGEAPSAELAPFLRTTIALQHRVCRPVFYSLATPGYYDTQMQECEYAGNEEVDELSSSENEWKVSAPETEDEEDDELDDSEYEGQPPVEPVSRQPRHSRRSTQNEVLSEMSTLTPCPSTVAFSEQGGVGVVIESSTQYNVGGISSAPSLQPPKTSLSRQAFDGVEIPLRISHRRPLPDGPSATSSHATSSLKVAPQPTPRRKRGRPPRSASCADAYTRIAPPTIPTSRTTRSSTLAVSSTGHASSSKITLDALAIRVGPPARLSNKNKAKGLAEQPLPLARQRPESRNCSNDVDSANTFASSLAEAYNAALATGRQTHFSGSRMGSTEDRSRRFSHSASSSIRWIDSASPEPPPLRKKRKTHPSPPSLIDEPPSVHSRGASIFTSDKHGSLHSRQHTGPNPLLDLVYDASITSASTRASHMLSSNSVQRRRALSANSSPLPQSTSTSSASPSISSSMKKSRVLKSGLHITFPVEDRGRAKSDSQSMGPAVSKQQAVEKRMDDGHLVEPKSNDIVSSTSRTVRTQTIGSPEQVSSQLFDNSPSPSASQYTSASSPLRQSAARHDPLAVHRQHPRNAVLRPVTRHAPRLDRLHSPH